MKQGEQAKLMDEVNQIGTLENVYIKLTVDIEGLLDFKVQDFDERLRLDSCFTHKRMIQSLRDQLDKIQTIKLKKEEEIIKLI